MTGHRVPGGLLRQVLHRLWMHDRSARLDAGRAARMRELTEGTMRRCARCDALTYGPLCQTCATNPTPRRRTP